MPKPVPAEAFIRDPARLGEAPVYAVYGKEDYLRRKCLRLLTGQLASRGFEIRHASVDDRIAPVLDELRSPSLFGGLFAVVIRNQRVGPRHEVTTRFKDELAGYLERPGRNVLVFEGVTWQRNLTVPKRVGASFPTVACDELKPWDVRGWNAVAAAQAVEHGLKPDQQALTVLREYVGASLARAEVEMQKLALLCDSGRVTAADVARGCGYEGADVTFPLCDAILTGNSARALSFGAEMAGRAEVGTILPLLALLRLQVVALGRAAQALKNGASASEAISRSGARLRENLKAGFLKTARNLGRDDVRRGVEVLLNADEAMKSASPDPANLLVSVVADLCKTLHKEETARAAVR